MPLYDPDLAALCDDPAIRRLEGTLSRVGSEVMRALDKFPPFNSPHEGYAVIKEELEELWDEAKANNGRSREAHDEAIQVAAMAVRYVLDLREESAACPAGVEGAA